MGNIKADFLAEFFTAKEEFILGYNDKAVVDSVQFSMSFFNANFTGDSISPMGVTVYKLDNDLPYSAYVDSNPADYTDMKTILGQHFFSMKDLVRLRNESTNVEYGKAIVIDMEKSYGEAIYNEWRRNPDVLKNIVELRKFIKGVYVTSNFNNKSIIEFSSPNSVYTYECILFISKDVEKGQRAYSGLYSYSCRSIAISYRG